jgi:hypothetical protein
MTLVHSQVRHTQPSTATIKCISRPGRGGSVVAAHSFGFERQLRSALHEAALSSFDGADVADVADVSLWISVGNNCLFASC